ncbi:Aste57867_4751 [Aphanomyces stellatus]|uniref:Aste57867_4751 protein n=1 Tax=Aphanomyces stellatus TaxID=120398 RepID=A0A485KBU6_9STRA|nr:hypothetical protein As57867_004738 [Aphanomyces stellatus]VFT81847.1 Aste57867_4751 [Aphanomyces stellatus]
MLSTPCPVFPPETDAPTPTAPHNIISIFEFLHSHMLAPSPTTEARRHETGTTTHRFTRETCLAQLTLTVTQVRAISFRKVVSSMLAQHGLRCKLTLSVGGHVRVVGTTESTVGQARGPLVWSALTGRVVMQLNRSPSAVAALLGVDVLCGSLLVASTSIDLSVLETNGRVCGWHALSPDGQIELDVTMGQSGQRHDKADGRDSINQVAEDNDAYHVGLVTRVDDDDDASSDGEPSPEKLPKSKSASLAGTANNGIDDDDDKDGVVVLVEETAIQPHTLLALDTLVDPKIQRQTTNAATDEAWALFQFGIAATDAAPVRHDAGDDEDDNEDTLSMLSADTMSTISHGSDVLDFSRRVADMERSADMFQWTQRIAALEKGKKSAALSTSVLLDEAKLIRERRRSLPIPTVTKDTHTTVQPSPVDLSKVLLESPPLVTVRQDVPKITAGLRRSRSASVRGFQDILDQHAKKTHSRGVVVDDATLSPTRAPQRLELGRPISIAGSSGIVRYIGAAHFASGIWVGIELTDAHGKNNGSIRGVQYFTCPDDHGIFIRANKLDVSFQ